MLRMMTYNVHNFKRYGAKNDISTKHEILEIIADQQPDIIGFQEFYTRNHGQYDMLDSIQKILKCNNYFFEAVRSNRDEAIGMAIFSKFPISCARTNTAGRQDQRKSMYLYRCQKGRQNHPGLQRPSAVYPLRSGRLPLHEQRTKQGKPEVGSAKRLGLKLKTAFLKRSEQVFKIKNHADSCSYPYIISGDFNDTPASFAVNQMSKGLKNAFREKGSGLGRTYNGSFPNYQIDYIMASGQFNVTGYNIIQKQLSDHYPVCSDLQLK